METFVTGIAGRVTKGGRKSQLVAQINNWDLVPSASQREEEGRKGRLRWARCWAKWA